MVSPPADVERGRHRPAAPLWAVVGEDGEVADQLRARSVAFPAISTGVDGFPAPQRRPHPR
ncbi:macro domain-containing protein [Micromonospora coerulea]|uniref:macro domain-containing protein n=1 Tax=Micromonospora coerulea TaxID=47856 RepID=UPI003555F8D7